VKVTKSQLKQIIKEELEAQSTPINEAWDWDDVKILFRSKKKAWQIERETEDLLNLLKKKMSSGAINLDASDEKTIKHLTNAAWRHMDKAQNLDGFLQKPELFRQLIIARQLGARALKKAAEWDDDLKQRQDEEEKSAKAAKADAHYDRMRQQIDDKKYERRQKDQKRADALAARAARRDQVASPEHYRARSGMTEESISRKNLKRIIKEELEAVIEFEQPDADYENDYNRRRQRGTPSPERIAQKKRAKRLAAPEEETSKEYQRIINGNPKADELHDQIQDYGYANNFEVNEKMLTQFLEYFPEGPVRDRAERRVTYFY
jgi:hypothetical protein